MKIVFFFLGENCFFFLGENCTVHGTGMNWYECGMLAVYMLSNCPSSVQPLFALPSCTHNVASGNNKYLTFKTHVPSHNIYDKNILSCTPYFNSLTSVIKLKEVSSRLL